MLLAWIAALEARVRSLCKPLGNSAVPVLVPPRWMSEAMALHLAEYFYATVPCAQTVTLLDLANWQAAVERLITNIIPPFDFVQTPDPVTPAL